MTLALDSVLSRLGIMRQQKINHLLTTTIDRILQRVATIVVATFQIGSKFQETLQDGHVAGIGSPHQCSLAFFAQFIHIRAPLQQLIHNS
jgi:hypothetical protein